MSPTSSDNYPKIICAVDDNYAMSLVVLLKSIEENLKSYTTADVYILVNNISSPNKTKIHNSLYLKKLNVFWIIINNEWCKDFKISHHISETTYYRILIADLFENFDKAIYLDCDIVVNTDIGVLWDMSLNGSHLLAVPQISKDARTAGSKRGLIAYKQLGIAPNALLFNAGVLLINLKLWRESNVSGKVTHYLKNFKEKVLWWDQDGLNVILSGKWGALDYRWNVMTSIFRYYSSWENSPFNKTEYKNIITSPYIIHYNSTPKPWDKTYNLPYVEIFFAYLDKTLWSGWRP